MVAPAFGSKGRHPIIYFEIMISPVLDDPMRVAGVLAHELVHATVGTQHGHKGPFAKLAKKIGLEGKMTATTEGEAFKQAVPSHVPSHPQTAAKVRGFSPIASGFTAETDWLLERDGFEPSVPRQGSRLLRLPESPNRGRKEIEFSAAWARRDRQSARRHRTAGRPGAGRPTGK
jgi:hypothetical protein